MPPLIKTSAPQILNRINQSRNILLHCHPAPDGDSLGSVLAMAIYLISLRKNVTVIKGDSELPRNFDHLPGFSLIEEKTFFDIDINQYDLFLILDTADLNQISKIDKVSFPPHLDTITIDHHASNPGFSKFNLIDHNSPSTCQIIAQLFDHWGVILNHDIAINLFVGIYTDTGGFKYPKTTSQTFEIISKLVKHAPDFPDYIFQIENQSESGQIRFRAAALNNITEYFNGRVVFSTVSFKTLQKYRVSRSHTEKSDIANLLKSVIGWDITASIVEIEPETCAISFRTRDAQKYDLSLIASATGSGGGHPAAAGATVKNTPKSTEKYLIKIIKSLHPELGEP